MIDLLRKILGACAVALLAGAFILWAILTFLPPWAVFLAGVIGASIFWIGMGCFIYIWKVGA